MNRLHHHPRFHLLIHPQLLILFITLTLFIMALWLLGLSQTRPVERTVPASVVATEQRETPPSPHPFQWVK